MKKLFLFFFSFLIINISNGQVNFGLKSGINIATTRNIIAFPKNRLGWHAGGFVTIPINKKLYLQPELIFSSKGNRSYNQIGNDELTTKYNYLNMPILLAYKIDHRTSLFLGPELGYLTTVYLYINSSKVNVSKNYPPKFDLGLAVGLNYKLVENIGIVVRYNYGFKTIYSTDAVGNRYNDYNGGHRVLQIGLNYLFLK